MNYETMMETPFNPHSLILPPLCFTVGTVIFLLDVIMILVSSHHSNSSTNVHWPIYQGMNNQQSLAPELCTSAALPKLQWAYWLILWLTAPYWFMLTAVSRVELTCVRRFTVSDLGIKKYSFKAWNFVLWPSSVLKIFTRFSLSSLVFMVSFVH